jgi:CDP-paratose 2-epimerase
VAWFLRAALAQLPITIFGDGKQVRDLLHVQDLLNAYDQAIERIDEVSGRVYNVGGGPANSVSVWAEFSEILKDLTGRAPSVQYAPVREGDQRVYITDGSRAASELGWWPTISFRDGMRELLGWLQQQGEERAVAG